MPRRRAPAPRSSNGIVVDGVRVVGANPESVYTKVSLAGLTLIVDGVEVAKCTRGQWAAIVPGWTVTNGESGRLEAVYRQPPSK